MEIKDELTAEEAREILTAEGINQGLIDTLEPFIEWVINKKVCCDCKCLSISEFEKETAKYRATLVKQAVYCQKHSIID